MQNPSAASQKLHYHPHLDINTSHTIRNPVTQAELTLASLSIISPLTRITEFNYNPEIPVSYYTNVYLPNATLTGYKNGTLVTMEAHTFACVHFNHADHQILELASLNAPDPEGHVSCINNAQMTRPSTPVPSTTNLFTTNNHLARSTTADPRLMTTGPTHCLCPSTATLQHGTTAPPVSCSLMLLDATATSYHITAAQPASQPDEDEELTPTVPAFLLWEEKAMLENTITFGSTPVNDHIAADNANMDEYTPVKWTFLNQVLGYCQGKEELQKGISIPEELCQGE